MYSPDRVGPRLRFTLDHTNKGIVEIDWKDFSPVVTEQKIMPLVKEWTVLDGECYSLGKLIYETYHKMYEENLGEVNGNSD